MKFAFLPVDEWPDITANFEQISQATVSTTAASAQAPSTITITATSSGTAQATGCSFKVPIAGTYVAMAIFDFTASATGWGDGIGQLTQNGVAVTGMAVLGDNGAALQRVTTPQNWMVQCAQGDVLATSVYKLVAGGTLQASSPHTTLTVFRAIL